MSDNTINILSSPIVKASLILKNASSNEWELLNPILLKGELGIENDTKLIKIGDGINHYNDLEYINIPADQLEPLVNSAFLKIINPDEGDFIISGGNID